MGSTNRDINMNSRRTRNTFLALIGLAALFVCILACTSFSPDDKKILYPTFDPKTRSMGVAVYDRSLRESRILFTSKEMLKQGREPQPVMMRSQWLAGGKNVVITWCPPGTSKEDENVATFAMLPLEGKEPVRLLHLGGLKDPSFFAYYPLPMVGTRAFVNTESNIITTLDLLTGDTRVRTNSHLLMLFASPVPGRFGFVEQVSDERLECGMLDPETMTKEWRVGLGEKKLDNCSCPAAFSPVGKKAVFSPEEGGEPVLQLYEEGQSPKPVSVPVAETEQLELGQVAFSPDGRSLVVAFASEAEGKTGHSLGIIELPLDGRPPRRTVLISGAEIEKEKSLGFFQFGLSHDGKALAVSSVYLAVANKTFRAEDCALFIVDLASAERTVAKIPIPLPAGRGAIFE